MMKFVWGAGHGYNTPGKRTPDGMREWEFNSAVVKYAIVELANYSDVAQLRVDDSTGKRDVPLSERTDRANGWGADVYVSVHANAYGSSWNSAEGIETYIHPRAPKETYEIALALHGELIVATGRKNRGVKQGDFHVLRETKMHAVLVECGFMTNKEEAALLKSDEYRKKVALALVNGLVKHFNLKRKPEPKKEVKSDVFYRVVVGSYNDRGNAESQQKKLKEAGFDSFLDVFTK